MAAPKGNKFGKGGLNNPPGGRPTKTEQVVKLSFLQALERERDRDAAARAKMYYKMAMKDPATMRHAVDRVMPPAKQEIGVTGTLIFKSNVPEGKP